MSKLSAESFVKIQKLVDAGRLVSIKKWCNGYQISVHEHKNDPDVSHSHYLGESLPELLDKVHPAYFETDKE